MECEMIWTTGKIVTKPNVDGPVTGSDAEKGCRDEDQFSAFEVSIPLATGVLWEHTAHGVLFVEMGATVDCGSMASDAGASYFWHNLSESSPWLGDLATFAQAVCKARDSQPDRWTSGSYERAIAEVEKKRRQRGQDAMRRDRLLKERAKIDAELSELDGRSTDA